MSKEFVEARRAKYLGKTVEFVCHGEPDPDPLQEGDIGPVVHVDDEGTLSVRWKSGRKLGVLVCDEVRIVE